MPFTEAGDTGLRTVWGYREGQKEIELSLVLDFESEVFVGHSSEAV